MKKIILSFLFLSFSSFAETFIERLPVYAIMKPGKISTLLAVNHGMVADINFYEGDSVQVGKTLLSSIEKETQRNYRTTIKGKVAKLHVTNGAALTPGMPLVTVIDPKQKRIQVSFSPQEAKNIKKGAKVFLPHSATVFGKIEKISPLVDPDTGAVVSFIRPIIKNDSLIGDVLKLEVEYKTHKNCKVVSIKDLDKYLSTHTVKASTATKACLTQQ